MHDHDDQHSRLPPDGTPAAGSHMAGQHDSTPVVACPFCHSTATELLSPFGGQLSTAQYHCRACHSYFDYIKQEPE
jgi:hypothetical protein